MPDVQASDLVTIALLVVLEGLLSADNALVMAIMVLGLPRHHHSKALKYGLVGGFALRILATFLAVYLIRVSWVKLLGGLYLLHLTREHFTQEGGAEARRAPPVARPRFGMSALWATVAKVEMANLAFSVDSILVAVAMSPKPWVVVSGGLLGIVALRLAPRYHSEVSRARRWRVHHHRVGRRETDHGAPPHARAAAFRDSEMAVDRADRPDLPHRACVRAQTRAA